MGGHKGTEEGKKKKRGFDASKCSERFKVFFEMSLISQ
jgi:hypothetical protein